MLPEKQLKNYYRCWPHNHDTLPSLYIPPLRHKYHKTTSSDKTIMTPKNSHPPIYKRFSMTIKYPQ